MRFLAVLSGLVRWALGLAFLAGILAAVHLARERARALRDAEAVPTQPPRRAANKVIKLGAQLAASHGIADEPAQAVAWAPRVAAYGRVVPHPRGVGEVRAPFAGTLRAGPGDAWPSLGRPVQAGQVLAHLDVRVGPQERLDLVTKLNEARLKQLGAEEHLALARGRVERLQGAGGGVSRAELDSAQTQLTEAKTQLATAKAAVKEWQDALAAIDRQGGSGKWTLPLAAPAAGELTELTARPGMIVEAGGLIARVVEPRLTLVRLELPPEATAAPAEVELFASGGVAPALEGASNRPEPAPPPPRLRARLLGPAPQVEVGSQYAAFWYEADAAQGGNWRPGLAVKALVKRPDAKPLDAVAVAATALLYHQGRALVYVRLSPGRYERREVQVLGRDGERWVLAPGEVRAGEPVVSRRAQVLLSEEFRGEADND